MKKAIVVILLICFVTLLGCNHQETMPVNVIFKNATLKYSTNYTITAVYQEDKRLRDFQTDILIMSDVQNLELKITKELGESKNIVIPEQNVWYSLTNLLEKQEFATFATVETTTYIINTNQKANIQIKAVGGKLNQNQTKLESLFDVSRVFELKFDKTTKIA